MGFFSDINIGRGLEETIKDAGARFDSWVKNLQYGTVEYTKMNRDYVKKQKISPDAVMQAAIQVSPFSSVILAADTKICVSRSPIIANIRNGLPLTNRAVRPRSKRDERKLYDRLPRRRKSSRMLC